MIEVGKQYRKGSIIGVVIDIAKCPCSHECACVVAFTLMGHVTDRIGPIDMKYRFSGDEMIGFELVRDD